MEPIVMSQSEVSRPKSFEDRKQGCFAPGRKLHVLTNVQCSLAVIGAGARLTFRSSPSWRLKGQINSPGRSRQKVWVPPFDLSRRGVALDPNAGSARNRQRTPGSQEAGMSQPLSA